MAKTKKPWPVLESDDDVDEFVANADLTEYDLGKWEPISHEFEDKSARVTLRMPTRQLASIKAAAEQRGVKYQKFMRELMSRGMRTL